MPMVTFRSARFSSTPTPDAINEMLGKDLGEWLRAALADQEFEVGEVIAEDYGYGFWLRLNGAHYWIMQTQYEPATPDMPPTWLVGIDYDPGCLGLWWLRARPKPNDRRLIARALHAVLASDARLEAVQWWPQDVQRGTPQPTPG
ncbi:MAG: hypothetical protein JNJ61_30105 [Anaerolineae bacterium]|nr:hypothetical protein [Anaerolineae bacterium]